MEKKEIHTHFQVGVKHTTDSPFACANDRCIIQQRANVVELNLYA